MTESLKVVWKLFHDLKKLFLKSELKLNLLELLSLVITNRLVRKVLVLVTVSANMKLCIFWQSFWSLYSLVVLLFTVLQTQKYVHPYSSLEMIKVIKLRNNSSLVLIISPSWPFFEVSLVRKQSNEVISGNCGVSAMAVLYYTVA